MYESDLNLRLQLEQIHHVGTVYNICNSFEIFFFYVNSI
jgi:hypothetical protein